jgi:hypothetical protein
VSYELVTTAARVRTWRRLAHAIAPPPGSRFTARLQRLRSRLWLFALVAVVSAIYAFFVSAGRLGNWPGYISFHDSLAEGFRAGKLSIPLPVAPELLAAKNPYDPVNSRYWVFDATYYKGHYYIYWGPVPALMQAAAKSLLGIKRLIGDQYLVFFFSCQALWFGALLIERMARRLFGNVSRLLVGLGVLALAFANPTLHAVTTASVYAVSIVGAQAWLLAGMVPAFDLVWDGSNARSRRLRMALVGTCWALALATRVTVAPAIALLVVVTAVAEGASADRRWWRICSNTLWLAVPLTICGALLLTYNKLRFDDWLEFGTNLQLAGFPTFRVSSSYLVPNLYSYMLRPFVVSCQFPYLFQVWTMGAAAFPEMIKPPPEYMVLEPVVGWLRAVPISWMIPFAFLLTPRPLSLTLLRNRSYLWCLVTFTTLASLTGIVGMSTYGATMRYMSDITYGLVLLSLLGAYALRGARLARYVPKTASAAVSLLALATVVIGIFIGYHGYNAHFSRYNPELDAKFVKALSLCGNIPPELPRYDPMRPY